jgi:GTP-binding protein YchF
MGIQAGLVGLPNVGKSTLFNALTKSSVPAENYPFCTIDPHLAITEVPDARLEKLLKIFNSQKIIPATVQFVDIAGLVKGAASGEGLGNQFLSHIREVDLILHVLRCFEDPNIIYQGVEIDPLADYEIIIAELMLKDLESVDKRVEKVEREIKAAQNKPVEKKEFEAELALLKAVKNALDNADADKVRELINKSSTQTIPLLVAKNYLIIANIAEDEIENDAYKNNKHYQTLIKKFGTDRVIPVSAKIEGELSQLNDQDAQEMMAMIGLKERSLDVIIKKTYQNLGLITFFTCGPKEIHAWPIKQGITIRKAAGEIHSDLERGFICAEVYNCQDLFAAGSVGKLKELGKLRTEGQDYVVQDGDIVLVRFNV